MHLKGLLYAIVLCCSLGMTEAAQEKSLPRTILALYDSENESELRFTYLHRYAEMPLNYLGYRLVYHDVQNPLPDVRNRSDILGVITWYRWNERIPNPRAYVRWLIDNIDAGKKVAIMGNPGFWPDGSSLHLREANQLWSRFGVQDLDVAVSQTYDSALVGQNPQVVPFERVYQGVLPPYRKLKQVSSKVSSHVVARQSKNPTTDSSLVLTGPNGGFAVEEYAVNMGYYQNTEQVEWYVNPFRFFGLIFDQQSLPKVDVTTLAGRRIYYSHIDGDGWNSLTLREEYKDNPASCAEVICNDFLRVYDDLPCTVAPIAADISRQWVGTERSREITRKLFELPHVEMGCHTFTHPFDWNFFAKYTPEKELPYLDRYPDGGFVKQGLIRSLRTRIRSLNKTTSDQAFDGGLNADYAIPRAYALQPFSLDLDVRGAIEEINALAPAGKKVAVYQWSGNCAPFLHALQHVQAAGVKNLNGGGTRFDGEFHSYAYVFPLGRSVGKEQQIYASNSNENIYTNMWQGKYYGFNRLPETFKNTESPLRICPMNLYYHMYSGERRASFHALQSNIAYIRSQNIAPITASHFAAIAEGFYSSEVILLEPFQWKIMQRGKLQTIRFDGATLHQVDFARSRGVVGQRHHQGSLYTYLDEDESAPVVALQDYQSYWEEPRADRPYLIESRWPLRAVQVEKDSIAFVTNGFGEGEMRWRVPIQGRYRVSVSGREPLEVEAVDQVLYIELGRSLQPVKVSIHLAL